MRIFVAGTGFTGSRIAHALAQAGHEVVGMNRSGHLEGAAGFEMVAGDVMRAGGLRALSELPAVDAMVSALSASGLGDPQAYRELYVKGPGRVVEALQWTGRPQVWLLGSTGVYGGADGEWVDEDTPVQPMHRNGEVQVEAEQALQACTRTSVLRLSGLYGPGRTRLIRQALRQRPWFKPDVWSNQIHAEDVARTLVHLAGEDLWPEVLLVSDDRPALRREIFTWVRGQAGLPEGLLDEDHPPGGRDRGSKRVSNRRLRELGVHLRYPDYPTGLSALLPAVLAEFR
jgi:electron-transferring-flavoprotein dehydrogenase